jgi:PST family polysaccharide transporter
LYATQPKECTKKINDFFYTQLVLLGVSFVCLLILVQTIPFFHKHSQLLYVSFFIVAGQVLLPVWFFQGVEKMTYLAYFNLLAKLVLIVGIMLCIRQKADYIFVNLFWGLGNVLAGLGAWVVMMWRFNFRFCKPSYQRIRQILLQDFHLFVASITNIITFNSTVIILGLFATKETLGLYSVVDRIFMIIRQVVVVIHQSTYPRVAQLAQQSFKALGTFFSKYFRLMLGVFVPLSLILCVLAPTIVRVFTGQSLSQVANYIQVLSITPLFTVLNLPACQTLLVTHKETTYTVLSTIGAVFHLSLSILLIYNFGGYGAVVGLLITELVLCGLFSWQLYKVRKQIF